MIGTSERSRSRRQTSSPSPSGRRRSSSTRSAARRRQRLGRRRRALDGEALAAKALGERLGDRVLVLDEQDLHASHHRRARPAAIRTLPNLGNGASRTLASRCPAPYRAPPTVEASTKEAPDAEAQRDRDRRAARLCAAVLGTVAASRTVSLGASAQARERRDRCSARAKQLDAFEASLAPRARPQAAGAAGRAEAGRRRAGAARRLPPAAADRRRQAHPPRTTTATSTDGGGRAMTSHAGRLYVLALALVVFFLAWATLAAHPWGAPRSDPRARRARGARARLRHEAKLVNQVVAARWATYRAELKLRRSQIAAAQQAAAAAARRCAS